MSIPFNKVSFSLIAPVANGIAKTLFVDGDFFYINRLTNDDISSPASPKLDNVNFYVEIYNKTIDQSDLLDDIIKSNGGNVKFNF